jgi:hypothetical protein
LGEKIKKTFFLLGSQEVPFGIVEKKPRQAIKVKEQETEKRR